MDLVLNGMEEMNEQELMMVDGGGKLTDLANAIANVTVIVGVVALVAATTVPAAITGVTVIAAGIAMRNF